jgi:hypothetical protein
MTDEPGKTRKRIGKGTAAEETNERLAAVLLFTDN